MKSLKFSIFFIFIFALSLSTIFQTKAFASAKTPSPANSSQSVRLDGCPDLRGKGVCLGAGYANITEQDYIDLNLGFEFDFDVVGIGVNVPLRIKTKGGLAVKENEWDDPNDYFRVIRYLRIGNKGDTFYGLIGELRNVLIGHGTIMSGYTNLGDPAFWNVGLAADLNFDQVSVETVFDNIIKPNLLGGRLRVGMGMH